MHSSGKLERAGVFVLVRFLKKKKVIQLNRKEGASMQREPQEQIQKFQGAWHVIHQPTTHQPTERPSKYSGDRNRTCGTKKSVWGAPGSPRRDHMCPRLEGGTLFYSQR